MEWSLDKNRARTREIWPSEAAGALGTAAAAKAPRGSGGLPKQSVSWKSHRGPAQGGLPKTPESTIGEEWSPSPLPSVPVSDQGVPRGVASVGASPWGLSHSREPV